MRSIGIFLKLLLLASAGILGVASAQSFTQKFDTKNHPNAKGLDAEIRYPQGWIAKGSDAKDDVVQTFLGKHNGIDLTLQLQVIGHAAEVEPICLKMTELEFGEAMSRGAPRTAKIETFNSQKIIFKNKPSFSIDLDLYSTYPSNFSFAMSRIMVCHRKNFIMLWCGSSNGIDEITLGREKIKKADVFCKEFFNTLVLN